MHEQLLYRKITRIIMQLADELQITPQRALLLFYGTTVAEQMHDPKYGYQIMSDTYIVNDIKRELAGESCENNSFMKDKYETLKEEQLMANEPTETYSQNQGTIHLDVSLDSNAVVADIKKAIEMIKGITEVRIL